MVRRVLPHLSVFVLLVFIVSPLGRADQLAARYLLIRRNSIFLGEDDTPSRSLSRPRCPAASRPLRPWMPFPCT